MCNKNDHDDGNDLYEEMRDLVSHAKEGDSEAIGVLYRLYERRLKGAAKKKLGSHLRNKMETVDLVQSVWKDCLSDMNGFEYRGPESFFHWMLTRVLRKVQDKARFFSADKRDSAKEKRLLTNDAMMNVDSPFSADPTPSQAAIVDEELDHLMGLLDHLTDPQRQTVVLRLRDKMTFTEIGAVIGKSADSARKLYGRALVRIEEILSDRP